MYCSVLATNGMFLQRAKKILKACFPDFIYKWIIRIYKSEKKRPKHQPYPNIISDNLIVCNLCGSIFRKTGLVHSEFLACPTCNSIARDRVMIQAIIYELFTRSGEWHPILVQGKILEQIQLLECSPRETAWRGTVLRKKLKRYVTSDFDMSAHRADIKLDLTKAEDVNLYLDSFDIILCAHVLEHVPDYQTALTNLYRMLAPEGILVLQVPILEAQYTPVTWDEFHGDNTRVFHRFGFDLLKDLDRVFSSARIIVGSINFSITSPEISQNKYQFLKNSMERCQVLGEDVIAFNGLGSPDLCDAFIAYKSS